MVFKSVIVVTFLSWILSFKFVEMGCLLLLILHRNNDD